ncbi:F-box only protein 5 [Xenopus tropicalis]|uniref:F-box only protein 5 n=1 Tax=Xenopus tropicalis TaxID=8364 RepID=FBX5_XENTR|nr:F-box only protein 5 [Xenopus tropicalis]Q28GK6.1 RecName: Full=F-box only protein 5 [Xenopus tropicalis]CAJ81361.1 F-box protein 5 [Xenopus tropicalis]|eukprot:NP_001037934.1 F-box only protein 5 [Xenopus tropicalis]
MMCGFTSNQSPKKLSSKKLSATNVHLEISPVKCDSPCKGYENVQASYLDTANCTTVTRGADIKDDLPLHNKENLLHRFGDLETHSDEEYSGLQDSGYSSILQNDSPCQDETDNNVSDIQLRETPKNFVQFQKPLHTLSTKNLPALRFEEAMCSTLKKMRKTSKKIDWNAVDDVVCGGNYGLENLIGKNMGLERFDILAELFHRDFKHLLTKILRHLSAMDLINVISVSTTWRKILQKDNSAYNSYKLGCKELCEKKAKVSAHTATRDESLCRVPLASVQKVAASSLCTSKKQSKNRGLSNNRHAEFIEVAQTLKNDQCLKVCVDCSSPAKYDPYLHRATCTRESCKFDFCTLCSCKYHGSKCCQTSKPRSYRVPSEPLPGSKKSKQNLRRL